MYTLVKHLHLTAIAISLALFILRFFWLQRGSSMLQKKWVKIVPHVVDTVLLASAITLCVLIAQYPFVNAWVTEKLMAVLLYILMGLVALKLGRTNSIRWIGFVGAICWLLFAAKVAVFKQPLLFS
ncbi:SirB2 family protein [Bowmanella sp. Y26]|uniref:SirB2 family protein n=1 Tax=Bowmanella yangjiangensis TaxID=2811230 RepID=UPI001BDC6EA0|nr:SirB2 family protein [Bowmanella yangjiangensis]MBT1065337.1 SirB2 family protein [Bowmanella yangjiangensis]